MLFLLWATTPSSIAAAGLAMRLHVTSRVAASVFVAGNPIAGRELDFQLDNFIPLLIAPIALGH